jgi:hypothetical protein
MTFKQALSDTAGSASFYDAASRTVLESTRPIFTGPPAAPSALSLEYGGGGIGLQLINPQIVRQVDRILILEAGRIVEYGDRQVLESDSASRLSHLLRTGMEQLLQ